MGRYASSVKFSMHGTNSMLAARKQLGGRCLARTSRNREDGSSSGYSGGRGRPRGLDPSRKPCLSLKLCAGWAWDRAGVRQMPVKRPMWIVVGRRRCEESQLASKRLNQPPPMLSCPVRAKPPFGQKPLKKWFRKQIFQWRSRSSVDEADHGAFDGGWVGAPRGSAHLYHRPQRPQTPEQPERVRDSNK